MKLSAKEFLNFITQFGIPLGQKIYKIVSAHFETNDKPTDEMWQKLIDAENESHARFSKHLKMATEAGVLKE